MKDRKWVSLVAKPVMLYPTIKYSYYYEGLEPANAKDNTNAKSSMFFWDIINIILKGSIMFYLKFQNIICVYLKKIFRFDSIISSYSCNT